jgi:hypothetical protein
MKEIVFFLEERSAQKMLEGVLSQMSITDANPNILPRYIVFEGKTDMEANLNRRLRHYMNPNAHFIILRDQDSGDCRIIKNHLKDICLSAGKTEDEFAVRIACHELESFYLADLNALEVALGLTNLADQQEKRKYRDPDNQIGNAAEEVRKITGGAYQKVSGSEAVGKCLDINNTRSKSFYHLIQSIRRCLEETI